MTRALPLGFVAASALLLSACLAGYSPDGPGGGGGGGGGGPGNPTPNPDDPRLKGAGGRSLTEFWDDLDVPLSANAKMLAFGMMKKEVQRATGLSWTVNGVDQWEKNRAVFGGADYQTTFVEDISPSQQKLVLWRKMAYQVCLDAVTRDAGKPTRVLFTDVDPAQAIAPNDLADASPIRELYTRFFLDPPDDKVVTDSAALLGAAYSDGNDAKEAWRALCVGYLGSIRFLTY